MTELFCWCCCQDVGPDSLDDVTRFCAALSSGGKKRGMTRAPTFFFSLFITTHFSVTMENGEAVIQLRRCLDLLLVLNTPKGLLILFRCW